MNQQIAQPTLIPLQLLKTNSEKVSDLVFYNQSTISTILKNKEIAGKIEKDQYQFDDYCNTKLKDMPQPKVNCITFQYINDQKNPENSRVLGYLSWYSAQQSQCPLNLNYISQYESSNQDIEEQSVYLCSRVVNNEIDQDWIIEIIAYTNSKNILVGLKIKTTFNQQGIQIGGYTKNAKTIFITNLQGMGTPHYLVGFGGTITKSIESIYVRFRSQGYSTIQFKSLVPDMFCLLNYTKDKVSSSKNLNEYFTCVQPLEERKVCEKITKQCIGQAKDQQQIFDMIGGTNVHQIIRKFDIHSINLTTCALKSNITHICAIQVNFQDGPFFAITQTYKSAVPKNEVTTCFPTISIGSQGLFISEISGQCNSEGITYLKLCLAQKSNPQQVKSVSVGQESKNQNFFTVKADPNKKICGFGGNFKKYFEFLYCYQNKIQ